MGWIGDVSVVLDLLASKGADRQADGNFLIAGEDVTVGLDGCELVISAATVYYLQGKPHKLAEALNTAGLGVRVRVC